MGYWRAGDVLSMLGELMGLRLMVGMPMVIRFKFHDGFLPVISALIRSRDACCFPTEHGFSLTGKDGHIETQRESKASLVIF